MEKNIGLFALVCMIFATTACRNDDLLEEIEDVDNNVIDSLAYSDWSELTHAKGAELNYDVVFKQNDVLRFDIEISADNWSTMQSDLSSILGSSSGPGGPGGPGGDDATIDSDPVWVPCSFKFDNTEWYHVGVRYKGNSSLKSAYQSGNNKLSLKLDFDEFEDDYPIYKNQRFYGFKQLNLNNNFDDVSLVREKIGADLFRSFGLASAQTAFCAVYVDHGDGPQYFGVYTLVEEVDDTVLETQFDKDSGNLYKPDGDAASFAYGSYNDEEMELKTNKDDADYSDVQILYEMIHSEDRTSNISQWKTDLEGVFNVDGFLKWLAANTVIQNWDTYGRMTHNYYIYNNPENGLLTWIPWDNNEAFQFGKQGGALDFDMNAIGSNWPLIRYIMDQTDYELRYDNYMQQFIDEVFIPSELITRYSACYNLLKDYAYAEEQGYTFLRNASDFDSGIEVLKSHVQSRNDAVNSYLNTKK